MKKKKEKPCPLYLNAKRKYKYDYDMIMVYCPRCHAKFIDVLRPFLWEEDNHDNAIFICTYCGAKLFLW